MQTPKSSEQFAGLTADVFSWAHTFLAADESLADFAFGDFITISFAEFVSLLSSSQISTRDIKECKTKSEANLNEGEGRLMIVCQRHRWTVYTANSRGPADDLQTFKTRDEALSHVASKLWKTAVIELNSPYARKHGIVPSSKIGTLNAAQAKLTFA